MSPASEMRSNGEGTASRNPRTSTVQDAWLDLVAEVVIAEVLAEEKTKSFEGHVGAQEDTR